jgi:hypothetical protein
MATCNSLYVVFALSCTRFCYISYVLVVYLLFAVLCFSPIFFLVVCILLRLEDDIKMVCNMKC